MALCTAILLVAGLALAGPVQAATITVSTTSDEYNTGAACSLREAITAAVNDAAFGGCPAGSGDDIIQLQAATYVLDEVGAGEDNNVTGDLDIVGDITINGPATGFATIDANDIDRVFNLRGGGSDGVFMNRLIVEDGTANQGGGIQGSFLTFTNGIIRNNTATVSGGGADVASTTFVASTIVDNTGTNAGGLLSSRDLTLIGTRVESNDATSDTGKGGGIWSLEDVSIIDSAITFNTSQGQGGGIFQQSLIDPTTLTLDRTRVSNNSADDGGGGLSTEESNFAELQINIGDSAITNNFGDVDGVGGGNGGGILNDGGAAVIVSRTTLSGNNALDGGGIHNSGNVSMTNVTMSGNTSADQGGGIFGAVGSSTVLSSVTFDNNTAPAGGHIWKEGDITAANTLMGDDGGGGHCLGVGQPMTVGPNMESNDLDDCGFTIVPDVLIGPLQNNGGPRLLGVGAPATHALLAGSPAIDAASDGPPTDQRGVPRPQGPAPDLGAYERAFCQGLLVNEVGTEGDDSITAETTDDGVLALGGDDLVHGLQGDDHICGGAGNDDLWGGDPFTVGDGQDLLLGAGGNDTLRGGDAADDLEGGGGGDQLLGGAGADDASGGAGADNVVGNAGNDDLFGNGGPDKLAGGPDKDDCSGGAGTDSSTGCETKTGIP